MRAWRGEGVLKHVVAACGAPAALLLIGCESYRSRPLVPGEIIPAVARERTLPDEEGIGAPFTFTRAAELLARYGPALKEARAEHETALARARVKTPLSNPTLEVGPQYGFGSDLDAHRLQPFGSIGFAIPTAPKRARQDEMNRLAADLAAVELAARHREAFLDLRRLYARWALAGSRLAARTEASEAAARAVAAAHTFAEAGFATALDAGLLELEASRMQAETLAARREIAAAQGEMSALIGIHADRFQAPSGALLPTVPDAVPDLEALTTLLIANHPALARLRARYDVAEGALRLEIARQYPDFQFGPSGAGDPGERKTVLGLSLGVALPLFDRNQQGIAEVGQRREEVRAKFEAAANRALAALDGARWELRLAEERWRMVTSLFLPKAEANLETARKFRDAGAIDALRFLEVERALRAVRIEALDAERAVREAWVGLEQAVGFPLIRFPGEPGE